MSDRSSTQTTDPVDISVIVAARRRGVSLRVLAAQSCCSAQAVSSRIKNYERRTGEQIVVHAPPPHRGRVASICEQCGKTSWRSPHLVTRFCSVRCYHAWTHAQINDEVIRAIEMRQSGVTWTHIAKLAKVSQQSVQRRIWFHLRGSGQLTRSTVNRIWTPKTLFAQAPSWRWLANKFGEPA